MNKDKGKIGQFRGMLVRAQPEELRLAVEAKRDHREDIGAATPIEKVNRKLKLISVAKSMAVPRLDSSERETRLSENLKS